MINVPKEVAKYIENNEVVDSYFILGNRIVYTSQFRLYIYFEKTAKAINYSNIAGVTLEAKMHWWIIIVGLVLLFDLFLPLPDWFSRLPFTRLGLGYQLLGWYGVIPAISLIFLGILWKTPSIQLFVSGIEKVQELSGDKKTITTFSRLVNERKFKFKNTGSH